MEVTRGLSHVSSNTPVMKSVSRKLHISSPSSLSNKQRTQYSKISRCHATKEHFSLQFYPWLSLPSPGAVVISPPLEQPLPAGLRKAEHPPGFGVSHPQLICPAYHSWRVRDRGNPQLNKFSVRPHLRFLCAARSPCRDELAFSD